MVIFALRKFTGKPFSVIKFLKRIFYSVFRLRNRDFDIFQYHSSAFTGIVLILFYAYRFKRTRLRVLVPHAHLWEPEMIFLDDSVYWGPYSCAATAAASCRMEVVLSAAAIT